MKPTPKEQERLTAFTAMGIVRCRKERGVPLNHPEAITYIADWYIEHGRDGRFVVEIRSGASQLLGRENVMDGVPEMADMIQVELIFPDGTELVIVCSPIKSGGVGIADSTAGATIDGGDTGDINTSRGNDA